MSILDRITGNNRAVEFTAQSDNVIGTAPLEGADSNTLVNSDRQQKVLISRDATGCEWAYDNDVTVYNAVKRRVNLVNNGFTVKGNDKYSKEEIEKATKFIKDFTYEIDLRNRMSFVITMQEIHGWSVLRKLQERNGRVTGLMELNTKELKPIRNIKTGRLGDGAGVGLDANRPTKDIAIVQQGNNVTYSPMGDQMSSQVEYFYFTNDDVIVFPSNDRGKIAGTSDVMRCLRLVESKLSIQNMIELVVRRFGPQAWVIVGNKDVNFTNVQTPQKYMRNASTGAPIDIQTARDTYRNTMFSDLKSQLQKWSNGEALIHLAEYGVEPKILTPTGAIMNYEKYVDMYSALIKIGILGLDTPGRVDVTSGSMIENLSRDIMDRCQTDRETFINKINRELIRKHLVYGKFPEDIVELAFNDLDKSEVEKLVMIEFRKSQTVFNYLRAGSGIPEQVKKDWGIELTKEEEKKIMQPPVPTAKPGGGGESKTGVAGKPAGIQYNERQ